VGLVFVTLICASLVTFILVRVTGDPARFVLGDMVSEDVVREFRAQHGLDKPVFVQYWTYLKGVFRGDLGTSIRYGEPVMKLFAERIPATLELGGAAYLLGTLVGLSVGIYTGARAGRPLDKIIRVAVLFGQAVPGFFLGLVLIVLFSVSLRWFPTGGRGGLSHLVLPALTLSAYLSAVIVRFTRSAVLDTLHEDYVRTARAKGLGGMYVLLRHVVRNALIPIVTLLGVQSRIIFTGAVVTETVFSWPGVGRLAVQAIQTRDFPVIQGTVLLFTFFVVVVNLIVDVSYVFLDPRIRLVGGR
jgi:peptide/nickel transport system permease protein